MIENDSKNYHAWSYRQWVVSNYNLWEFELADVTRLIDLDIRNNSAWNERYFVIKNRPQVFDHNNLVNEIQFCMEKIRPAPNNESSWNYFGGYLQNLISITVLEF